MTDSNPRRIFIWGGFHSETMFPFVKFCWEQNHLLICCPPKLTDFSFVSKLPDGDLSVCGQWEDGFKPTLPERISNGLPYQDEAVLGVFTTGSTKDIRKLVLFSRANIRSCQAAIFGLFDLSQIKQVYCYPQPYHVFGLLLGYIAAAENGWTFYAKEGPYSSAHHEGWLSLRDHATLTLATPVHLRDLVQFVYQSESEPRPTYTCILGGARVDLHDWNNAKRILNIEQPSIGYGCTEASPGITHLPPGVKPKCDGDVGFLLENAVIDIRPDDGFLMKAPFVALATIENGALEFPDKIHVRDRIDISDDGRVIFSARTDSVLNRGGEKFSLEQIELLLKTQCQLDAICVPVADERLGQELAILTRRMGKNLTLQRSKVFSELKKQFGRKFNEAYLIEVDKLPVNDNSKYDRKVAADMVKRGLHKS